MTWQDEALAHAKASYPREACGLVVVFNGRERYRPCTNAAQGDDHFTIPAEEFAAAEDAGEVVGVFHSHCNALPDPSEADRVACEASGLTWHIVGVPTERWFSFSPSGYVAPLVGRQFQHGVLDCFAIVRDWYAHERKITLRDFDRSDDWWHKGQNLYMDNFAIAGFVETTELSPGAVILMQIQAPVANHAAIYLGDDTILHHLHGRLSSRDIYGGYYRRVTVKVLRYAGN